MSKPTTTAALVANGSAWAVTFTVLFFLTLPFWARPLLWTLAFVLDGLNQFGGG